MTIFVTGATGIVGFNLIRALLQGGETVRVMLRNNDPFNRVVQGLPIEIHYGEISNGNDVRRALKGCGSIYHAEERNPFGYCSKEAYREINVTGTKNVFQAALEWEIQRIVYTSTAFTIGTGTRQSPATEDMTFNLEHLNDPYINSKREAELLAEDFLGKGLEIVTLNPGLLLGPGNLKPTLGRALLRFSSIMTRLTPEGGTLFSDAEDVARVSLLAMKEGVPGERYIIGSESVKFTVFMDLVDSVLGISPISLILPRPLAFVAGLVGDTYAKFIGQPLAFTPSVSIIRRVYLDLFCSTEKTTLKWGVGWTPLRETVEKSLQWLRERRLM